MHAKTTALDRSADALDQAFAQVSARLTDVRDGLDDLCARLADLRHVLNGQRSSFGIFDDVDAAFAAIRSTLGHAAQVASPDRFEAAVRAALAPLAQISSRTRELDAVATLTLVTARSLGLSGFEDYVANLRALSSRMRDDVLSLESVVTALRTRRQAAAALFRQADLSLGSVAATLDTAKAERHDTDRLLSASLADITALAVRLPGVAAAETNRLVRAMQFADAVAQRLDHIGTILARGTPVALALARALIDALVQETRNTLRDLGHSLDRIGSVTADAAEALSADSDAQDSPAARTLDQARKSLMQLAAGSARTLEAIASAADESTALNSLSAEAAGRFASVVAATDAVQMAAINAALLARQDDGREKAMIVLSIEVRQQAAACQHASSVCHTAIVQLSLPDDMAAFARVSAGAGAFHAAVTDTTRAVEAAGSALATLEGLRDAARISRQRLGDATTVAHGALQTILDTADALAKLAQTLPARPPRDAAPPHDIMDLYTMEAERTVHRRLFGLPEPRMADLAATGTDPLAAILF